MSIFSIFTKKNEIPFPFHQLKVDMHSHLIPGIDDGAKTLEDSIRLINGLFDLGYEKLITTPHVLQDLFPNSSKMILDRLAVLQTKIGSATINAAAEYYLDEYVDELLKNNEPLLPLTGNLLLVEFGFVSPPVDLENKIEGLQRKGYKVIIAHPERYGYYQKDFTKWEKLKQSGCLLQCNLLSFSGYYGDNIYKAAEKLAENQWIDLLGTDLHHEKHLSALQNLKLTGALRQLLDKGLMNTDL